MPYSSELIVPRDQRKRSRPLRMLRAGWRDTWALLREFRRPLLVAFVSLFIGGWIYGELLVYAGYERVPYVDLPYYMMALMVLETPTDVPPEPYLVFFWYLQPLVAFYIIGRGAAQFFRLFFVRSERRNAWEVALASTYRNHIILLGIGHVGLRVARTLTQMGFDVVAVDRHVEPEILDELERLDVRLITGDGRSPSVLMDAGLQHARAFLVCTSDDHINLEVVMRARDLNPDVRIVARLWDGRFAEQVKRFMNVEAVLSTSDLAAPSFAGAALGIQVAQTLKIDGAAYSMIQLHVEAGSFLDGRTIDELQRGEDMDIVLHGSDSDTMTVHPAGDTVVGPGDTLVIFARYSKIVDIVARNLRAGKK